MTSYASPTGSFASPLFVSPLGSKAHLDTQTVPARVLIYVFHICIWPAS